jgi:hypothetical protein
MGWSPFWSSIYLFWKYFYYDWQKVWKSWINMVHENWNAL